MTGRATGKAVRPVPGHFANMPENQVRQDAWFPLRSRSTVRSEIPTCGTPDLAAPYIVRLRQPSTFAFSGKSGSSGFVSNLLAIVVYILRHIGDFGSIFLNAGAFACPRFVVLSHRCSLFNGCVPGSFGAVRGTFGEASERGTY